jgi:predicted nucleotidyltransferase
MPQHDLSKLDLPTKHVATLQALLKAHTPNAQAWVYGSRVMGQAHEGSDVDIVLRNKTDLLQDTQGLESLVIAIQESNIPILVDVHQWSSLPVSFHDNIEHDYVEIQP